MNKQKIGILLLCSPILIILISILLEVTFVLPVFIEYILLILFFIGSPIFVGIGIYLLIKHRDKEKSFITNRVSKKRKIIGKIILFGIICPIFLLLLYTLFGQGLQKELQNEFCPKCNTVTQTEIESEAETLEPTLIGTYEFEADEYIYDWDIYEQGYFQLERYIDTPREYIFGDTVQVNRSWDLKNGYKLDVECEEIDISTVDIDNPYKCSIYYNDKLIRDDIKHEAYCFYEGGNNCVYNLGIVVYSNPYVESDTEHLITMKYISNYFTDISVYVLEDGEYKPLFFKYKEGEEYLSELRYMVSSATFDLYGVGKYGLIDQIVDGDKELVTYFSDPTMGIDNNLKGIDTIWRVEDDGLYLRKTVMEVYREEEMEN
jgi:hypothetical protein